MDFSSDNVCMMLHDPEKVGHDNNIGKSNTLQTWTTKLQPN